MQEDSGEVGKSARTPGQSTITLDNRVANCYTTSMTDTDVLFDIKNRIFFGEWCRNTMDAGKHGCVLGLLKRTGAPLTQRRRIATLMAQAIRPGFPGFVPAGWFVAFWNDKQRDRKAVEEMIDRVIVRLMFEPEATAEETATRTPVGVV